MERYKNYEPDQSQLLPVNPEVLFPRGSFERFIVDIINQIDFNNDENSEDKGGESPYNPKSLLGIIFYSYANGIFSSRKMEIECKKNLGFMFVSGYNAPDHSTISRFINNNEQIIEKIFVKLLYIADECGYLDYKLIATDGSKIKANASSRFSGTLKMFRKKRENLKKKIHMAIEKQKSTDKIVEKEYWKKKEKKYEENKNKIDNFLVETEEIYNFYGKEIQQNITDKDCRRMKSGMEIDESYNGQISACGKNDIIIATEISNDENDYNLFTTMADKIEKNAPIKKDKLKNSKYLFDNGYYRIDTLIEAENRNMNVFIANKRDQYIYNEQKKEPKVEKISIEDCKIRKYKDFYSVTCPGGLKLTDYSIRKSKGRKYYAFPVVGKNHETCMKCKLYEKCRGKNKYNNTKTFSIRKEHLDNKKIIDKHTEKLKSEYGKRIYSKRMSIVEKIFAQIKTNIGFKRFLRRGLKKIRIEWLIVCLTYNLKRICALS